MYRNALNIFSLAAGSFALGYVVKHQNTKEIQNESQNEVVSTAKDLEDEAYKSGIIPSLPTSARTTQNPALIRAISKARELVYRLKNEVGAPGLVIGVSIDGKNIWTEGELRSNLLC